jgi:outer membrane protein OmpA-like peptidoglycan-associated protein
MRTTRLLALATAVMALGATGCATKGYVNEQLSDLHNQVNRHGSEIDRVRADAETASATATSASQTADELAALARGDIRLSEARRFQVYFGYDSAELDADARAILDEAARAISDNPGYLVSLYGLTDPRGSADYNERLGQRRAAAVQRYLIDETPVELGRFSAMSFGETPPGGWSMTSVSEDKQRQVVVSLVERVPRSGDTQLSQRGD